MNRSIILLLGLSLCLQAVSSAQVAAGGESIMVMEAHSGKVLVASNSTQKRPIASLTKMATAAVAVDWAAATGTDISKVEITVPGTVTLVGGPNPLGLSPGDRMSLRDAIYAMMLSSDNLAALSVADHVGRRILQSRAKGGEPVVEFVAEMNRLAQALGMRSTRFGNPHGLERKGVNAYSTAADVARLSVYVMRLNALNFIVRQTSRTVEIQGLSGNRTAVIRNTNELLGHDGVLGIKTGTTAAAGPCLATSVHRDPLVRLKPDGTKGATPRRLIVVVLNSQDRFGRTRGLIQRGWATYDAWLNAGAQVTDPKREIISVPNPI